jgi:ribosomal protein S18 acetylase RimI-like enzyme
MPHLKPMAKDARSTIDLRRRYARRRGKRQEEAGTVVGRLKNSAFEPTAVSRAASPICPLAESRSATAASLRSFEWVSRRCVEELEAEVDSSRRLVPSLDLVHRVSEATEAYTVARMGVLERIPGNPVGIAYRTIGNVAALMARHLPSPFFNKVVGLRRGQAEYIRPLVEWYREQGVATEFEITSGDTDPALGRELARLGFFQSGCHAALIGEPDLSAPAANDIPVESVTSAEQMEEFLAAYVLGWGFPEDTHEQFKKNVRPWRSQPGWSLYLARVDGRPAAAGILFIHEGVGYFADSATDPAFRGRGLQSALLRRRLQDASAAGVDLVCSGADFLSTSHRNMERVGMRLLFLRSIWTPLD